MSYETIQAQKRAQAIACKNLRKANLSEADLSKLNLRGADLIEAYLPGANLTNADLTGANLSWADLFKANLKGANLQGADLSGADLNGTDLTDADLTDADLTSTMLRWAIITPEALKQANTLKIKEDLYKILRASQQEVPNLMKALLEGKIEGTSYEDECACLIGTIARTRGVDYKKLPSSLQPNANRPAERWFYGIKQGDTPQTSPIARITAEWIQEWARRTGMLLGDSRNM
jgi:hypothetical protein